MSNKYRRIVYKIATSIIFNYIIDNDIDVFKDDTNVNTKKILYGFMQEYKNMIMIDILHLKLEAKRGSANFENPQLQILFFQERDKITKFKEDKYFQYYTSFINAFKKLIDIEYERYKRETDEYINAGGISTRIDLRQNCFDLFKLNSLSKEKINNINLSQSIFTQYLSELQYLPEILHKNVKELFADTLTRFNTDAIFEIIRLTSTNQRTCLDFCIGELFLEYLNEEAYGNLYRLNNDTSFYNTFSEFGCGINSSWFVLDEEFLEKHHYNVMN